MAGAKKAAISISLIADAAGARAGFKKAEEAAGSFGKQMGNLTKTIAATFAAKKIVDFAKSSIGAASDLNESINAVNVVFKDAANGILDFGKTASKTVGMSANDFNSFAVQFAGFTKQLAGDQGDIVQITTDLTTRIADFASVMNLDIPRAAEIFQSTLAGQKKPIAQFGIDMSAAAVEAYALEAGIAASASSMTEAEKVTARFELLMRETADTAGDFANTSGELANSQRILKADVENMQAELGQALLPVMKDLTGIAIKAVEAFGALPDPIKRVVTIAALAGGVFLAAKKALEGFGLAGSTASKSLGAVGIILTAAVGIYSLYNRGKQAAVDRTNDFVSALREEASSQSNAVEKHIAAILASEKLESIYSSLGLSIKDVANIIQGETNPVFEDLERILGDVRRGTNDVAGANSELGDKYGITFAKARDFVKEISNQESALSNARKELERNETAQENLGIETDRTRLAIQEQNDALDEQEKALNAVVTATLAQFNAALGYESQTWRTKDAIDAFVETQWKAITGEIEAEDVTRALAEAQNSAASAALNQAAAATKLAEEQAAMRGETLTAAEAALIQIAELEKVATTLDANNPLRKQLEGYIRQLGGIPTEVGTVLSLRVRDQLNVFGRLTPQMQMRAKGGPVSPTMGPYIVGEEGPEVFVPGQTGMILPNTALIDAMATKPTGVTPATQPTVIVNVQGSVTSERDLVESIRQGLLDSQRSGRRVVLS